MSCVYQTPRFLEQGHDVLIDIFKCINIFLSLLKIYADIPPTLAMTAMVVQILLELLAVLAIATKQIGQGRFGESPYLCIVFPGTELMVSLVVEIYARKRLGEKDIESILQRFDRLTLDGSTMTVAQTLGAVYALVNDMRVVMEGAYQFLTNIYTLLNANSVDEKASTDVIRQTLGEFVRCTPARIILTSASPFASISNESEQDRTFVPLRPRDGHFSSYIN